MNTPNLPPAVRASVAECELNNIEDLQAEVERLRGELRDARLDTARVASEGLRAIGRSNELLLRETAAALAHRACCGTEHDPPNGKLHGYCVVCGVPWPCETAQFYLRPAVAHPEGTK